MISTTEILVLLGLTVVPLTLLGFWIAQFVQLMSIDEERFAGAHDKLIWVVVFVALAPVAPFAFMVWKSSRRRGALTVDQPGA